jgi:hypothetical protein
MISISRRLAGPSLTVLALALLGGCAVSAADAEGEVPHAMKTDAGAASEASAPADAPVVSPDADAPSDASAPATTLDAGAASPDTGFTGGAAQDGGTSPLAPDTGVAPPDVTAPTKSPAGKFVMTWYSFQDNTPVNSALSASGRKLVPFLSVAVPFRLLKPFGGKWNYGDRLYVAFLEGRTMPNGAKHTGWVQIDDFCGDSGDDSYCFQSVGGAKYPNVDLYLGDFTKSGMDPKACSGPAGSGQELSDVATGNPGSAWIPGYGGKALGSGKCGDVSTAKPQQAGCWDYTPPASSASDCASCASTSCTSW